MNISRLFQGSLKHIKSLSKRFCCCCCCRRSFPSRRRACFYNSFTFLQLYKFTWITSLTLLFWLWLTSLTQLHLNYFTHTASFYLCFKFTESNQLYRHSILKIFGFDFCLRSKINYFHGLGVPPPLLCGIFCENN